MPHEGINDRLEPLDLGVGLALGEGQLSQLGILNNLCFGEHPGLRQN